VWWPGFDGHWAFALLRGDVAPGLAGAGSRPEVAVQMDRPGLVTRRTPTPQKPFVVRREAENPRAEKPLVLSGNKRAVGRVALVVGTVVDL
jgi:hypothetical protein